MKNYTYTLERAKEYDNYLHLRPLTHTRTHAHENTNSTISPRARRTSVDDAHGPHDTRADVVLDHLPQHSVDLLSLGGRRRVAGANDPHWLQHA